MPTKYYIDKVGKQESFCLIKCDGGYYTKYASYAKDKFNNYLEFGDRLVSDPTEHSMVQFSVGMAYSEYGNETLAELKEKGFINPRFVTLHKAECTVIIELTE